VSNSRDGTVRRSLSGTLIIPWILAQIPATFATASAYGVLEGWLAIDGSSDWWPLTPAQRDVDDNLILGPAPLPMPTLLDSAATNTRPDPPAYRDDGPHRSTGRGYPSPQRSRRSEPCGTSPRSPAPSWSPPPSCCTDNVRAAITPAVRQAASRARSIGRFLVRHPVGTRRVRGCTSESIPARRDLRGTAASMRPSSSTTCASPASTSPPTSRPCAEWCAVCCCPARWRDPVESWG
jgi:hypothetical protein